MPHAGRSVRPRRPSSYRERTHWPLQSLYFLLPLIVFYEVGVALLAGDSDISARPLLRAAFEWFGVTGYYLPGLLLVAVLLAQHLVRRDPWEPELKLYGLMWLESIALATPLFVFTLVLFRQPVEASVASTLLASMPEWDALARIPDWPTGVVFSIGAGIYEELLFRLIAIAAVHLILVDLLDVPEQYGAMSAIGLSAVAFALYHFPEPNPLNWSGFAAHFDSGRFLFYTAAGVYLAGVYVLRGFGIVVATHALYNIAVVTVHFWRS